MYLAELGGIICSKDRRHLVQHMVSDRRCMDYAARPVITASGTCKLTSIPNTENGRLWSKPIRKPASLPVPGEGGRHGRRRQVLQSDSLLSCSVFLGKLRNLSECASHLVVGIDNRNIYRGNF